MAAKDASLDAAIAKLEKVAEGDPDPEIRARAKRLLAIAKGETPPEARASAPTYEEIRALHLARPAQQFSHHERELLAKLDKHPANRPAGAEVGPHMEGSRLVLDYMSPERAFKRMQELRAAGVESPGTSLGGLDAAISRIEGKR